MTVALSPFDYCVFAINARGLRAHLAHVLQRFFIIRTISGGNRLVEPLLTPLKIASVPSQKGKSGSAFSDPSRHV